MPELLNTQDVLSASKIKSAGDAASSVNPRISNTSGTTSGNFSQVYSESVGKNEARVIPPDTVSNREQQRNAPTIGSENGKPANLMARVLENNGNSLPTGIVQELIPNLLNGFNPESQLDASESMPASQNNLGGATSITGLDAEDMTYYPESTMPKEIEVSSKSLPNSTGEALGSKLGVTSIGLDNAKTSEAPVYNGKSNEHSFATSVNTENSGVTTNQESKFGSQKTGNTVIASTVALSDTQDAAKHTKCIVAMESGDSKIKHSEQILHALKPVPSEPIKLPLDQANIKDRILSPNLRPSLFQGIDENAVLKSANLKSVANEAIKEVSQAALNQTLRVSVMPNVESPGAINKDFSRIINSQYTSSAPELALNNVEEIDNNSLRTQFTLPKSGLGFSSLTLSGAPVTSTLTSNINSQAWPQEFSQQLVIFAQKDIKQANLQLNPQRLGPMEVRISMGSDQQVNVSFNTQHGMVKEAIDSALPRLREMFEQQGLNLGDVNVSQNSEQNARKQQFHNNNVPVNGTVQDTDAAIEEEQVLLLTNSQSNNIVDYYA